MGLPSYIRARRRGSSMKLRRLAFRGSGYGDIPPIKILSIPRTHKKIQKLWTQRKKKKRKFG